MLDAFEKRRLKRSRFIGPVSASQFWGHGGGDAAYRNYCNLIADGYKIRVFLNEREILDCLSADSEKGVVEIFTGLLKGDVEVRLERGS